MSLWKKYIEDVKDRSDIVEVVGRYIPLDRKGRIFKAKCPFHHETDPSFVVFPDSQRWQCFGACNEGGDVIAFVMKSEGWEFTTALHDLGRRAGVEPPARDQEAEARYRERRRYEDELEIVAGFFRQQIEGENEGREYAHGRGFSDETIDGGRLGYAPMGGLGALKQYLAGHDIEPGSRADRVARKIQGYAYHKGGALVYIHQERGRTVYLSARAVQSDVEHHETKYNPPVNVLASDGQTVVGPMAGAKRPFVVGKALKTAESVAIVEGQACAVTLVEEWGAVDTAIALAGIMVSDVELVEQLAHVHQAYVALDNDRTGREQTAAIAEQLGALVRVITWPEVRDANDLLQVMRGLRKAPEGLELPEGDETEYVRGLLDGSPTWLDVRIEDFQALDDSQKRAQASEEIAELYGELSRSLRLQLEKQVCEGLGIGVRDLNNLVKMVLARKLSKMPYASRWGMICRQNGMDDDGTVKWSPLAPVDVRVDEETVHDDGQTRDIFFHIVGTHREGYDLPGLTVNAKEYNAMNWLTGLWGTRAYAMEASMHHLRRAILELSEPEQRTVYTHLGWRKVGGQRVYLYHGGGVGCDEGYNVDVELDNLMMRGYTLPPYPEELKAAMEASLRFLDVAPLRVTGPLWAAMYLAPVSEIIEPDFIMFVYGKTGTMKSTLAGLALNHYGPTWAYNRMPASWNDTVTTLEAKAFLAKDAPLIVDDYARDVHVARSHDRKVQLLVRNWANRTGKSRSRANLTFRPDRPPRGLVISSGEQLPPGQSIIGRLFPVEISPSDLSTDTDAKARLSQCQAESGRYGHAMTGYLLWLRERWDDLRKSLPAQRAALRDHDEIQGLSHLRIPSAISTLYTGFDLAMSFYTDQEVLSADQAQEWRERFWAAIMEDATTHNILVQEEDPIARFVRIIADSFAQGVVWAQGTPGIEDTEHEVYSEKLGFVDEDWLYLFGEATLAYVQEAGRKAGDPFPLNRGALYKGLVEARIAVAGTTCTTLKYRHGTSVYNVLKLRADRFGLSPQPTQLELPEGAEDESARQDQEILF